MRRVPHSGEVTCLDTWDREYDEEVRITLPFAWSTEWTDEETGTHFAAEDGIGGQAVTDPTTLYLSFPLGDDWDNPPQWETTLSEVVDYLIDGVVSGSGKIVGPEAEMARKISDSFIMLAERINSRIT